MNFFLPFLAIITSVADIRSALLNNACHGETFEVRARIDFSTTRLSKHSFRTYSAGDADASTCFFSTNALNLHPGDVVVLRGTLTHEPYGQHPIADVLSWERIGSEKPTAPLDVSSRQLTETACHLRPVRISGELVDVLADDIDKDNTFLVLQDPVGRIIVSCAADGSDRFQTLIGARIVLVGIAVHSGGGMRRHLGSYVMINGQKDMTVLKPPPKDPFDAPPLVDSADSASVRPPGSIGRRSVRGHVVAAWHRRELLVRSAAGPLVRITLRNDGILPAAGTRIAAVGIPETDAFTIRLRSASVRTEGRQAPVPETPVDLSGADIVSDSPQERQLQVRKHGCLIRLTGEFLGSATQYVANDTLNLFCDGRNVAVDCSACPQAAATLERGSVIEVTGIGVIETESPSTATALPRILGLTPVLRSTDDIRILATPSWWTIGRLLGIICTLVALLLAILVWNRLLQRMIRRRSAELVRMELAKVLSDLRVSERTQLAVDIHDSLSQTLTGVAFQIDAAEKTVGEDDAAARNFLAVARRTLASCREELRRCLWDLRNNAIGEGNFGKAIELVLKPYAQSADIAVRFNMPRAALTDTTAHDILSIIRELVVNAIRHGQATHLHVAGEKRDGIIRFSVTDDGRGFDPARRPGVDEGHFGIQGIFERLNRLGNGRLDIQSTPGKGSKFTVEIGK